MALPFQFFELVGGGDGGNDSGDAVRRGAFPAQVFDGKAIVSVVGVESFGPSLESGLGCDDSRLGFKVRSAEPGEAALDILNPVALSTASKRVKNWIPNSG